MHIFVTGATGFIGSHFLKLATNAEHIIFALKRKDSQTSIILDKEPVWVIGDLDSDFTEQLEKCDVLVHFAAQGVSPQPTDWSLAFEVNVRQSITLIDNALKSGIKKIICCGSCMEYGKIGERYEFIPANAPLEPIGPYAASKAAFSLALGAIARTTDAYIQMVRPFNLFGEGQHESNFWPSLRKAALSGEDFPMTSGLQIRDFLSVEEAAAEFIKALDRSPQIKQKLHIRNIGSGIPTLLKDFADHWWHHWEASGQLLVGAVDQRENEVMRFVPEIS